MKKAFLLILIAVVGFQEPTAGQNSRTVLPKPTGPFAVGSRYFYLPDKNRADLISPDPDDSRAISLQVWYPAEPGPADQLILLNDKKLIESYVQDCQVIH